MSEVRCRFCGGDDGAVVLDLGHQPACDHFPLLSDAGPDPTYPLRMWLCAECGLAQLAEDPTTPDEPRGQEPAALSAQARDAVDRMTEAGLVLPGGTVVEYGSPHGGSWLDLLEQRGARLAGPDEPADLIVDCFGLMHEPKQCSALRSRAERLAPGGTLLLQFHSLATIMLGQQWNALRHGHFAYYSTPVLVDMVRAVGLAACTVEVFELYGGTVLLVARRDGAPDAALRALIDAELDAGVRRADVVRALQDASVAAARRLADQVRRRAATGARIYGYGAASRAVSLLCRSGVNAGELIAIADASPAKTGRRMPGTDIPVVSTAQLVDSRPDEVVLFVPDLLPEVREALPQVEQGGGRWVLPGGPGRWGGP